MICYVILCHTTPPTLILSSFVSQSRNLTASNNCFSKSICVIVEQASRHLKNQLLQTRFKDGQEIKLSKSRKRKPMSQKDALAKNIPSTMLPQSNQMLTSNTPSGSPRGDCVDQAQFVWFSLPLAKTELFFAFYQALSLLMSVLFQLASRVAVVLTVWSESTRAHPWESHSRAEGQRVHSPDSAARATYPPSAGAVVKETNQHVSENNRKTTHSLKMMEKIWIIKPKKTKTKTKMLFEHQAKKTKHQMWYRQYSKEKMDENTHILLLLFQQGVMIDLQHC